jgi:GNAT superfamily N-acetyltransferase
MIRVVRTKDHHALTRLNEEIQTFHHTIQPTIFKPYDKESVLNFFMTTLNREDAVAYLAEDNQTPIGYVLLFLMNIADNPFQYSRRFILLDQIVVLDTYRGQGVGRQLLDATIAFAKENSMTLIELNHWTNNESARQFFNKNKFEYYNEKMWRELE